MNCQKAKELIDLRVHESACAADGLSGEVRARGVEPFGDWSELDAHLDACPQCRAELRELERVRGLLMTAADDRPTNAEMQTMWTNVQAALAIPSKPVGGNTSQWWARNRPLLMPLAGVAAVLVISFYLGNRRYDRFQFGQLSMDALFSNVDSSVPTGSAGDEGAGERFGVREERANGAQISYRQAGAAQPLAAAGAPVSSPAPWVASPPIASPGFEPAAPPADKESSDFRQLATAGTLEKVAHDQRGKASGRLDTSALAAAGLETGASDGWVASSVPAEGKSAPQQTQPSPAKNLKVIKTGELTVQVSACGEAIAGIEQIAQDKGGFVADAVSREEAGGALVGRVVVRVPPEQFEDTFAALKSIGRIESENVKAADVTADYVDTEARIHSLQITEERLRELIANKSFVDKIASLLEVEKEMNRVRTEIEQLQGQLRVMADRVSLATIVVTVREPGRTVPTASLSVEVATLDDAAESLGRLLATAGGRLVSGKTSKRTDGTLMGNYQLETTVARFAEMVSAIEAMGRVEERQVKDQQFSQADEPWADRVKCTLMLVLFERSRQLPSASLRFEVDSLEAAMKQLGELLAAHQVIVTGNQANRTSGSEGGSSAELRLRVPAGRFTGFIDALAPLGRSMGRAITGETGQVVGGAAAVPCDVTLTLAERRREVPKGTMSIEVAAFENARRALSAAIAKQQVQVLNSSSNQRDDGTWQGSFRLGVPAREMESFVSNLESLGRVAGRQISGLGLGDLSRTDPDAVGVIELSLGEKSSLTPAQSQTSGTIRARVREGLGGFYDSIGLIAYGLVVLLPWLLLAALLGWLVARIRRSLRNRKFAHAEPG